MCNESLICFQLSRTEVYKSTKELWTRAIFLERDYKVMPLVWPDGEIQSSPFCTKSSHSSFYFKVAFFEIPQKVSNIGGGGAYFGTKIFSKTYQSGHTCHSFKYFWHIWLHGKLQHDLYARVERMNEFTLCTRFLSKAQASLNHPTRRQSRDRKLSKVKCLNMKFGFLAKSGA